MRSVDKCNDQSPVYFSTKRGFFSHKMLMTLPSNYNSQREPLCNALILYNSRHTASCQR